MADRLTLEEARAIIDRAVEKGTELGYNSCWAITDEGGNILSISRMDGAPAAAVPTARAKAYLAAVMKGPTGGFSERMHRVPERWSAYQQFLPQAGFPGPGGMPIQKDGEVVGGFSSSLSVRIPDKEVPKEDGQDVNLEDWVTCYALDIPYKIQH